MNLLLLNAIVENDIQSGNGRLESKIYQLMFMKSCLAGDEIDISIFFIFSRVNLKILSCN